LKNAEEALEEFEGRMNAEVRRQERIDMAEERDFKRGDVTNFIQLVSSQLVDRFSQTKLHWKAPNEGYPHMCGMYKSDNK